MRILLLAAAASLASVGSAVAGDVPSEGSADMTAGTSAPGNSHPGYTYDQPVEAEDPIPHDAVNELRSLAIEEFGQATSSAPGEKAASEKAASAGVKAHREGFWSRVKERGVSVPDA